MTADSNAPQSGITNSLQGAFTAPKIIYVCYLIGFVFPLAALGGLVYAYIARGENADVDTHLTFQIRTFWFGLLASVIGGLLSIVLIGWILIIAWVVWTLTRCITGLQLASRNQRISEVGPMGFLAK